MTEQVQLPSGRVCFARLRKKYKGAVFIRKGSYFIVEVSADATDKVCALVEHVLYDHHVKFLKKQSLWYVHCTLDMVVTVHAGQNRLKRVTQKRVIVQSQQSRNTVMMTRIRMITMRCLGDTT